METQVKVDLTDFRLETRKWLEENCPISMRGPVTDAKQLYWEVEMENLTQKTRKFGLKECLKKMDCSLLGNKIWWRWT